MRVYFRINGELTMRVSEYTYAAEAIAETVAMYPEADALRALAVVK